MPGDADGAGEDELDFVVCAPSDNGKTMEATIAMARAVLGFIVLGGGIENQFPKFAKHEFACSKLVDVRGLSKAALWLQL